MISYVLFDFLNSNIFHNNMYVLIKRLLDFEKDTIERIRFIPKTGADAFEKQFHGFQVFLLSYPRMSAHMIIASEGSL